MAECDDDVTERPTKIRRIDVPPVDYSSSIIKGAINDTNDSGGTRTGIDIDNEIDIDIDTDTDTDTDIGSTSKTSIMSKEDKSDEQLSSNNIVEVENPAIKNESEAQDKVQVQAQIKPQVKPQNEEVNETIDATTFIFRSPATREEINAITDKMRSQIDSAHKILSEGGYEAYRRMKRNRHKLQTTTNDEDAILAAGDSDEDDGMDTDDERKETIKNNERLSMLEGAVVKGNPRRYQVALVELAKKQNTIVNLGTGQGKTLIALLLIKHFATAFQEGKQTLFLVPSIALAGQHTTTLLANLPYTVATACHNSTRTAQSKEKMAEANILVATHGAARDLLMHYGDIFSFSRINLIIVDECHYCSGEHGYATIMKNFYHRLPVDKRPRVLGLTASPLVNVKIDIDDEKLGEMLDNLEKTLDCSVACLSGIGVANTKGEISEDSGYIKREAEERSIHYNDPNPKDIPALPAHENVGLHEARMKEFNQLNQLYIQLGPKLTAIYSATVAREISRNRYEEETSEQFQKTKELLWEISKFCSKLCENNPNGGRTEKLAVLEQLLEDIIESKGAPNTVGVVFVDRRITALALYDYFRNRDKGIEEGNWIRVRDTNFSRQPHKHSLDNFSLETILKAKKKSFMFDISTSQFQDTPFNIEDVENSFYCDILQETLPDGMNLEEVVNKKSADGLCQMNNKLISSGMESMDEKDVDCRKIRCDMIVRQCTQVFKYLDKSHHYRDNNKVDWLHETKRIKDVLDGLRTKKTNVLMATSVVEEGVDVEACAFVISFDNLKSTKAYVQMKGRARQHNAKFFVFQNMTPGITHPYLNLQSAQASDSRVRQYIETRVKYSVPLIDPQLRFLNYDGPSMSAENDALMLGEYRTSLALVDLASAKSLLNRYTLSIPMEATTRSTKDLLGLHMPQFEEDRLLLPAHIPSSARCVLLPDRFKDANKKEKQGVLSLIACVRLHKLNLLNDRLLPLRRKDMQNKLLGVALTELFASGQAPPQKSPPTPGESNEVYVYKLSQEGILFNQNEKVLGGKGRALCLVTLTPFVKALPTFTFTHLELGEVYCRLDKPTKTTFSHDEWTLCTHFHTAIMNTRWRKRTKSVFYRYKADKVARGILPPYVVGCLDENGEVDWARIKITMSEFSRSEEERKKAAMESCAKNNLPQPRIWSPTYDPFVSYIAYGSSKLRCDAPFPDKKDNVKTYADYFTNIRGHHVDKDEQLFAVQRQWYLPRKIHRQTNTMMFDVWKQKLKTDLDVPDNILHDGEISPCEGLVAALLPAAACVEAPIADASLFLHLLLVPQVLYHIDQMMTAQLFVHHCLEHLPILGAHLDSISKDSFDDVLEALTAKSCIMSKSYDRLEWLGDAVLKLVHTDSLVHSRDLRKWVSFLHEGDLSLLRSAMGSNNRLTNAAKSAGFDRYILFKQLGRGQWIPIGMELHEIDEDGNEVVSKVEEVQPGKKTSADLVESILGLVYLHKGFEASFDICEEMGITLPRDDVYETTIPHYKRKEDLMAFGEKFLGGMKFTHPELLEEAVTHPSCIHEEVPCYQRLEWFGDAVLCLYAREWIYKQYMDLEVGELVILEATVVCNETLAYVCVSNGLQRHLNHRDPSLPPKIAEFEHSMGPKGRGLWATDPPKSLSDIVESMFGAAHVDGGFEAGQNAVKTVMQPILNALLTALYTRNSSDLRTKAREMMHPKQYVHELAGGILNVKAWKEEDFALRRRNCPVWRNGLWTACEGGGNNSIGLVESFGIDLVGIEEQSSHVARNRACAIAMEIFEKNTDLILKLKSFSQLLRPKADEETQIVLTEDNAEEAPKGDDKSPVLSKEDDSQEAPERDENMQQVCKEDEVMRQAGEDEASGAQYPKEDKTQEVLNGNKETLEDPKEENEGSKVCLN